MAKGNEPGTWTTAPPSRAAELFDADQDASEQVDTGPTMRNRARYMVAFAFLLALPALLVGAFRASQAQESIQSFGEIRFLSTSVTGLQDKVQRVRTALWRFEAEPDADSGRNLRGSIDDLKKTSEELQTKILQLQKVESLRVEIFDWKDSKSGEPLLQGAEPLVRLRTTIQKLRASASPLWGKNFAEVLIKGGTSVALRKAHSALDRVAKDTRELALNAEQSERKQAALATAYLSTVGRDQIVLFLLLLFTFPLVLGLAPTWMIAPLERIRGVAQRIERGKQVREPVARGKDEVALVTRALRKALRRLEENDKKQKHKIFELGRLLRTLIGPLQDAVLVVNPNNKIAYANTAAAQLLGRETHNLESSPVDEACWSAQLQDAIERARSGDVDDAGVNVSIEVLDGRVIQSHVQLGTVRDQAGEVTRIVVVMRR